MIYLLILLGVVNGCFIGTKIKEIYGSKEFLLIDLVILVIAIPFGYLLLVGTFITWIYDNTNINFVIWRKQ